MSKPSDGPAQQEASEKIAAWVHAALRGDLGAFDRLVERFQRQALAVAYRLLNNRDDAMEVTQDALMKAYDKLASLSKPERFGPWLMRIVSNLSLNRRRSRALRRMIPLDAESADGQNDRHAGDLVDAQADRPGEIVSGEELDEQFAEALEQLSEKQRQALVLFSLAELPQKEVARQLGCSVQAVKWHVFSARKRLKDILADYL